MLFLPCIQLQPCLRVLGADIPLLRGCQTCPRLVQGCPGAAPLPDIAATARSASPGRYFWISSRQGHSNVRGRAAAGHHAADCRLSILWRAAATAARRLPQTTAPPRGRSPLLLGRRCRRAVPYSGCCAVASKYDVLAVTLLGSYAGIAPRLVFGASLADTDVES